MQVPSSDSSTSFCLCSSHCQSCNDPPGPAGRSSAQLSSRLGCCWWGSLCSPCEQRTVTFTGNDTLSCETQIGGEVFRGSNMYNGLSKAWKSSWALPSLSDWKLLVKQRVGKPEFWAVVCHNQSFLKYSLKKELPSGEKLFTGWIPCWG